MRKRMKRKTDKVNKVTSMQDKGQERKMSITLIDNPPIDQNTEEGKTDFVVERTESEENLLLAIEETENLRDKLKEKKEELENNKKKYENDVHENIKILINSIKRKEKEMEKRKKEEEDDINQEQEQEEAQEQEQEQ